VDQHDDGEPVRGLARHLRGLRLVAAARARADRRPDRGGHRTPGLRRAVDAGIYADVEALVD
jgi:hypothetical protein